MVLLSDDTILQLFFSFETWSLPISILLLVQMQIKFYEIYLVFIQLSFFLIPTFLLIDILYHLAYVLVIYVFILSHFL